MAPGNPLTYIRSLWSGQGRRTVPFPENDVTTFLDVPVEIRLKIWEHLSVKEQTALRQVCATFHYDVTQFVGVYAELTGPRPRSQWTLADQTRCIFAWRNSEPARFQENWDWISNSQIQSLSVRGLTGIPPDWECSSCVRNPYSLYRLVIELDETLPPNEKVPTLLNAFTNLRILNISWKQSALYKPEPTALEEFRQNAIISTREILKSLVGRHTLRELNIQVDIPFGSRHGYDTFLGELDRPTIDQELDYPTRLEKLKLVFPIFHADNRAEIPWWRALLDRQTQLRHLTFDLGFIYWSTFPDALLNNRHTLEELDLSLSNWSVHRTRANWSDFIPLEFWFNWRDLIENDAHLKSLRVVMSARCGILGEHSTHNTLNFNALNLVHLERLELQSVHLTPGDFEKIFYQLNSLKKVKLIHWHEQMLPHQLVDVAMNSLTPVLVALLRGINLEEVELRDWCLYACSKPMRKRFCAIPNYDVKCPLTWTLGTGILPTLLEMYLSHDGNPSLVITRKSAHQFLFLF